VLVEFAARSTRSSEPVTLTFRGGRAGNDINPKSLPAPTMPPPPEPPPEPPPDGPISITSIAPTTGDKAGGTSVTITGENFDTGQSATVAFGGVSATNIVVVGSTEITAETPENRVGALIDSGKIGSNLVITDNVNVANNSGGDGLSESALGEMGKSSGKWYAEIEVTQLSAALGVGVAEDAFDFNGQWIGSTTGSYGHWPSGLWNSVRNQDNSKTIAQGDIVMIAYDGDSGSLWFGRNGTWYDAGDPGAGTGATFTGLTGAKVLAITPWNEGSSATVRTSLSDFSHSVPSGFVRWSELQVGSVDVVVTQGSESDILADGFEYA